MKHRCKLSYVIWLGLILSVITGSSTFSKTPVSIHGQSDNFYETSGHLYAVDIKTGKEKWRFKTENPVAAPAVSNGIVYFGTHELNKPNYLYALDSQTGKEIWKFKIEGGIKTAPTVEEGRIFFGSQEGIVEALTVYALDANTGKEKLRSPIESGWPDYFTTSNGVSYFGQVFKKTCYLKTVAWKAEKEKWKFKTEDRVFSPVIHKGTAYFGSYDGYLYAVDTKTGKEKWKFKGEIKRAKDPFHKGDFKEYWKDFLWGDSKFKDNLLMKIGLPQEKRENLKEHAIVEAFNAVLPLADFYTWANENELKIGFSNWQLMRRAKRGELTEEEIRVLNKAIIQSVFWTIMSNQGRRHSPGFFEGVACDDSIYFSGDGYLYAFDMRKRKEKWKAENKNSVVPAATEKAVLFLEYPEDQFEFFINLHALDRETGKEKWVLKLPFEKERPDSTSPREQRYFSGSAPILIKDGIAYCLAGCNRHHYLFAVDVERKNIEWIFKADGYGPGFPTFRTQYPCIENATIYFGTGRTESMLIRE